MFYSFSDTREKLDYLESSKVGRGEPINITWLIETLRETNEMAERLEKRLKELTQSNHCIMCGDDASEVRQGQFYCHECCN